MELITKLKYEEEIVPNDESDHQENYDAEWLFGTSDVCIWWIVGWMYKVWAHEDCGVEGI